jgi:hypothetical protein
MTRSECEANCDAICKVNDNGDLMMDRERGRHIGKLVMIQRVTKGGLVICGGGVNYGVTVTLPPKNLDLVPDGSAHIGGSLLPSSDPRILTPVVFGLGTLKVVPFHLQDTHALVLVTEDRREQVLARHPNGYSCYGLLESLVSGDAEKVRKRADGLEACGGEVNRGALGEFLDGLPAKQEK